MLAENLEPKVTSRQELIVPSLIVTLGYMPNELAAFAKRLNEICDDMKIPPKGQNRQASFAKLFNVSQKGARKWLEGEGFPALERCIAIAKWAGVAVEWLVTGRGPKRPAELHHDLYAARILQAMEHLPEYAKDAAAKQIEALRDSDLPPNHHH